MLNIPHNYAERTTPNATTTIRPEFAGVMLLAVPRFSIEPVRFEETIFADLIYESPLFGGVAESGMRGEGSGRLGAGPCLKLEFLNVFGISLPLSIMQRTNSVKSLCLCRYRRDKLANRYKTKCKFFVKERFSRSSATGLIWPRRLRMGLTAAGIADRLVV